MFNCKMPKRVNNHLAVGDGDVPVSQEEGRECEQAKNAGYRRCIMWLRASSREKNPKITHSRQHMPGAAAVGGCCFPSLLDGPLGAIRRGESLLSLE